MTKRQTNHMISVLCDRHRCIFSRAQIIAALIGGAVGAFLGVQAYYQGWLG
nr:hypothetical protein [uncultured Agathobaculum sp.]